MTQNYSQTVEVPIDTKARAKQIGSLVLILLAFGLFALAGVVSWYIIIPAVVVFGMGCVYLHLFNKTAKEYTYDFSIERLVVVKKDAVNKQRRLLTVLFDDVVGFEIMQDLPNDSDVCACQDTGDIGVYDLSFVIENGQTRHLYFVPDEYMIALIEQTIKQKINSKQGI